MGFRYVSVVKQDMDNQQAVCSMQYTAAASAELTEVSSIGSSLRVGLLDTVYECPLLLVTSQ